MAIETVGVVGAGTMGNGIAQTAAVAGLNVVMIDVSDAALDKGLATLKGSLERLVSKDKLAADARDAALARITTSTDYAKLAAVDIVIEAATENVELKGRILKQIEGVARPDAIIATNTSSISITSIAAGLRVPQRVAGLHFFNPAPLMALVEVVSGLATAPEVAGMLHATAAAWGKQPVMAKSTPGFIVNRVARPYYAEALRVLNEQGGTPATIDAVMREAGGFRMGPFELMDLIGHDVNFAVTESVFRAYFNDPRYTPSLIQQELVNAGFLGRKSGRGFYDYRGDTPIPTR